MTHDKRKQAARAIMAETGMNYTAALREADRRHAAAKDDEPGAVLDPEAERMARLERED